MVVKQPSRQTNDSLQQSIHRYHTYSSQFIPIVKQVRKCKRVVVFSLLNILSMVPV